MRSSYNFCTDTESCISSWDKYMSELTGRLPMDVLGRKYYDVLPRIMLDDQDALKEAIERNKTITLKGYKINYLIGSILTDIVVKPVRKSNNVAGVKVIISLHTPLLGEKRLNCYEQLISINKRGSALAHSVRNHLNAIKGAIVYLKETYLSDPTIIEFSDLIGDEISRLEGFIGKFLSSSLKDYAPAMVDINRLLRNIEEITSFQARTYNISSSYEYADIPAVEINPSQFEHAVLNILNNAITAMPSGGQLKVKTGIKHQSNKDFVVVEIKDSGPGIDSAIMKSIPFSIKSREKGKGYGLFITHEILQYYGGHMKIRTKKGKGTTVMMFLPVERGHDES